MIRTLEEKYTQKWNDRNNRNNQKRGRKYVCFRRSGRGYPQAVEIEKAAFTRPGRRVSSRTLLLPYAAYYVAVEQKTLKQKALEQEALEQEALEQKTLEQGEKPGLDQDRIVGICGVKKIFEEGEISNVAVHPDYRGRGVSRRMLEMLIREAREGGVEALPERRATIRHPLSRALAFAPKESVPAFTTILWRTG